MCNKSAMKLKLPEGVAVLYYFMLQLRYNLQIKKLGQQLYILKKIKKKPSDDARNVLVALN